MTIHKNTPAFHERAGSHRCYGDADLQGYNQIVADDWEKDNC